MSGRSMAGPKVPASRDVVNGLRVCDPQWGDEFRCAGGPTRFTSLLTVILAIVTTPWHTRPIPDRRFGCAVSGHGWVRSQTRKNEP